MRWQWGEADGLAVLQRVLLGVWMVEILGVAIIVLGVGLKLNEVRFHSVLTSRIIPHAETHRQHRAMLLW